MAADYGRYDYEPSRSRCQRCADRYERILKTLTLSHCKARAHFQEHVQGSLM